MHLQNKPHSTFWHGCTRRYNMVWFVLFLASLLFDDRAFSAPGPYPVPPFIISKTYNVAGNYIFTVPQGVTSITVEAWGGGGRGGSKNSGADGTGGGGGGAYSKSIIPTSSGQSFQISVGAGSSSNSEHGGDSWVSPNDIAQAVVLAKGGKTVPANDTNGAQGGLASEGLGDVKYSGGNGANAPSNSSSGGGGSSAGTSQNGTNATGTTGGVAPSGGGNGGNGRTFVASGIAGQSPGGGGGGAVRNGFGSPGGGYGGRGQVIITYTYAINAGSDVTQCDNALFDLSAPTPPVGFSVQWSVISGTAYIYDQNKINTSVHVPAGSSAQIRLSVSDGSTSATDDVILTNQPCTNNCQNQINLNGDLENEGTANAYNLNFHGAPATLISNNENPVGWSSFYRNNTPNTSSFTGAYYLNASGGNGDPYSGTKMVYLGGNGFGVSALESSQFVECGRKYRISARVAAYSNSGSQSNSSFVLAYYATGTQVTDYLVAKYMIAPASNSWNDVQWQRYSFDVEIPSSGFEQGYVLLATLSNVNGILIDDVCVEELEIGSVAEAGEDIFNCSSVFNLNATPAPADNTGFWSVVSGDVSISNVNIANPTATINSGNSAQLRWNVTGTSSPNTITLIDPSGDGGFENGSTFSDNGWSVVNQYYNRWNLGNVTDPSSGSNVAFISQYGWNNNNYFSTVSQTVHLYKDVRIHPEADDITLSFKWKGYGESGYDRLLVYTAPTGVTPSTGVPASPSTTLSGATLVSSINLHSAYTYQTEIINLPDNLAGTDVRLIFTWQNDSQNGTNPPTAFDEVSLTHTVPVCSSQDDIVLAYNPSAFSATKDTVCLGDTATITASGCTNGTMLWSTGETSSTIQVIPATTTNYSVTCTPNIPGNTLLNPGFESSTDLQYWTQSFNPVVITTNTSDVQEGSKAAMINGTNGLSRLEQPLDVLPGERYVFTIWAKTTNTNKNPLIRASLYQSGWSNLLSENIVAVESAQYQAYTLQIVVPPNGAHLMISGEIDGGILYMDNGSLYKYTQCVAVANSEVYVRNLPNPPAISSIIQPTCYIPTGSVQFTGLPASGSWTITRIEGNVTYTGSGTNYTVSGLAPGNSYSFKITNQFGCTSSTFTIVNISPIPSDPVLSGDNEVCVGGQANVLPSNNGSWTSSNSSIASVTNGGIVTGIAPGNVTLTYTRSVDGCDQTMSLDVFANPSVPFIGPVTHPTCITPTGSVQLQNLPATGAWVITRSPGNVTYNGSGANFTVTGLSPNGNYTFTVTNEHGCTSPVSANVNINAIPLDPVISGDTYVCEGGSAQILPSSQGVWNTSDTGLATISSSGFINGLSPGIVEFTYIRDVDGCSNSILMEIYAKPQVPTITNIIQPTCITPSGSVALADLPPFGPWILTIFPGEDTIQNSGSNYQVSGLSPDSSYWFQLTDEFGCISLFTDSTIILPIPSDPVLSGATSVCSGNSAQVFPDSNGLWSSSNLSIATVNAVGEINGVGPGVLTLTYTRDVDGCFSTWPFEVYGNPNPPAVGTITQPTCITPSGSVELQDLPDVGTWNITASPSGISYSGTGENYTVFGLDIASTFHFVVEDFHGCTSTISAEVVINPMPLDPVLGGDTLVCVGSNAFLSPNSSGTWASNITSIATVNNSGVLTGVSEGIATLTYTRNVDGCFQSVNVPVYNIPTTPSISQIIQPTCILPVGTIQVNDLPSFGNYIITIQPGNITVNGSGPTQTIANLPPGQTYTLTVQDFRGCVSFNSVDIQILDIPENPIITGFDYGCIGSTTILGPTSGGVWQSDNTSVATVSNAGEVNGLAASDVLLTYTRDIDGCSSDIIFTVRPLPLAPGVGDITQPTCTVPSGSVELIGLPEDGAWTISRNPGDTIYMNSGASVVIDDLPPAGLYNFSLVNQYGCLSQASADVTINGIPLDPILGGDQAACLGIDGLVTPTSGGIWTSSQPSIAAVDDKGVVQSLSEGVAVLTYVRESDGCTALINYTVHPLPTTILSALEVCQDSTLIIENNPFLGLSPFEFNWSGPNGFEDSLQNVIRTGGILSMSGMYYVTITDARGCIGFDSIQGTVNSRAVLTVMITDVTVFNGSDGSIDLSVTGGTPPFTYNWAHGATTQDISGLQHGLYVVTVTDSKGCVVWNQPEYSVGHPADCDGFRTQTQGGWGQRARGNNSGTYRNNNFSAAFPSGLQIGCNNTLTLTSASEVQNYLPCGGPTGLLPSGHLVDPSCLNNVFTGQLVALTLSATFDLYDPAFGAADENLVNLRIASGPFYSSSVGQLLTEANNLIGGCGSSFSASDMVVALTNVNENYVDGKVTGDFVKCCQINLTATGGTICSGNSILLSASAGNGIAPYTFQWSDGLGSGSEIFVSPLATKTYTVTVTDDLGCSKTATATVIVNPTPSVTINAPAVCVGATLTLTPFINSGTPSFFYSWTGPNGFNSNNATINRSNASLSMAGNYFVTVTDSKGCSATSSKTVTINPNPTAPLIGIVTQPLCVPPTGSIQLNGLPASGNWTVVNNSTGATYPGSGTSITISGLPASANYRFRVIDQNTCLSSLSTTASIGGLPPDPEIGGNNISCVGIINYVDPSSDGVWSSSNPSVASIDNAGVVTALNPGTTILTYTKNNDGCDNSMVFTVYANPTPPVIESITHPTCYIPTGTIQLSGLPSTGFWTIIRNPDQVRYQNTGSIFTIQGLPIESSYSFRVVNENACISDISAIANINSMPANPVLDGPDEICEGDNVVFTPTIGGTWTSDNTAVATINNSGQVAGISEGSAIFSYIRTSDGCGSNIPIIVRENPATPLVGEITQPTCITPTGSVILGGLPESGDWTLTRLPDMIQYNGSGNLYTVTGLPPGQTYNFIVRNNYSCVSSTSADVLIQPIPANPVLGGVSEICVGLTAQVTPDSAGTWSSSNTSIATIQNNGLVHGIAAGVVTLTYTRSSDGCHSSAPFQVRNNPLTPFIGTTTAPTCINPTGAVLVQNLPPSGTWQLTMLPEGTIVSGSGTSYQWSGLPPNSTHQFIVANSFSCMSGTSANALIGGIPADPILNGDEEICVGNQGLVLPTAGGVWISSDPEVATVENNGLVSGISPGLVDLTYTRNSDGCYTTWPFTVHANPSNPLVTNVVQPTCTTPTGSVTLSGLPESGPWSLVRSPGNIVTQGTGNSITISNLPILTQYTFTVVDLNFCASGNSAVFDILDIPTDPVPGGDEHICSGFSAYVTPDSGGVWTSSNTAIATIQNNGEVTGIAPGLVTLQYIRTVDGCDATKEFSVYSSPIIPFIGTVTHPTCYEPTGSVTLSGLPLDGIWTITVIPGNMEVSGIGDSHIITGLAPDTEYTFTVSSEKDCSSSISGTVYILPIPENPEITGDSLVCLHADMSLSIGSVGEWVSLQTNIATITNDGIVTGIQPGFAELTFTRISDGCSSSKIVEVKSLPATPQAVVVNQPTCISPSGSALVTNLPTGGNWTLTLSPGNIITPGNGSNYLMTNIPPNNIYTLTLNDQFGCQSVDNVQIIVNPIPNGPVLSGDNEVCFGNTSQLTPSIGGVWWSSEPAVISIDQSGFVSTLDAGSAILTFTRNSDGCTSEMNFFSNPNPTASIVGDSIICQGGATVLEGVGGVIYNWSIGSTSASVVVNSTGLYGLTVTNSYGCVDSTDLHVTINNPLSVEIDYHGSVCVFPNKEISANVMGGTPPFEYQWAGPGGITAITDTVVIGENGNYYLTVTDAAGCSAQTQGFIFQAYDPLVVALQSNVCEGQSVLLQINSPTAIAYAWSSNAGNATTADVVVFPQSPSSTYTVTVTNDLGCTAEPELTIQVFEKPEITLSGEQLLCVGDSTSFSADRNGIWASLDPSIASIDVNGLVTTWSEGTARFIYTSSDNNCPSDTSEAITVYNLPEVVLDGPQLICTGQTTQLLPATEGTWISHNPSVASITNDGLVTGISNGVSTFTYTNFTTGCSSEPSEEVQVQGDLVLEIDGPQEVCEGTHVFLEANYSGGTWISGDTTLATVNTSGIVFGKSPGNVIISYEYQTVGCIYYAQYNITILSKPNIQYTGDSVVCAGETSSLLPDVGGAWISSDPAVATIATNGNVQTYQPGEVTFSFISDVTGCVSDPSGIFSVLTNPTISLDGNGVLCVGNNLQVQTSSTGIWNSSNPSVASIDESGIVTGLIPGTTLIQFTSAAGSCNAINPILITVVENPGVTLDYNGNQCLHDQSQLTAQVSGGQPGYSYNWFGPGAFTANTQTIFISVQGNYQVTITDNNGCSVVTSGIVYDRFDPIITGLTSSVCEGESLMLTVAANQAISYLWSANVGSSDQATVSVVPQVPNSTFTVTATNHLGCIAVTSANILVDAKPVITIAGPDTLCIGEQSNLQPVAGGIWTSLNPSVAIIDNTGLITGIAAGISRFMYTNTLTGCISDTSGIIVVNAPTSVDHNPTGELCPGETSQLTPSSGGYWTSGQASVASISASGFVTALQSGVAIFSFTNELGCVSPTSVSYTVHSNPSVVLNGDAEICIGTSTHLLPNSGGHWESTNPSTASIDDEGLVLGISEGNAQFIFTDMQTGCISMPSQMISVNDSVDIIIVGPDQICVGSTTSLSPSENGLWVSNQPQVAWISPSGIVTGLQPGTVTFSFTSNVAQCFAGTSLPVQVFDIPTATLQGPSQICVGDTSWVIHSGNGYWTSNAPAIASVNEQGIVTALSPGITNFFFTDTLTGCASYPTTFITINQPPAASILGLTTICQGAQTTLSPAVGGQWISTNNLTASVTSSGVVTAIEPGVVQFIFIEDGTGCISEPTDTIYIEAAPVAAITGPDNVCVDGETQLSPTTGGTWISSNAEFATVTTNGLVTAHGGGLVRFIFTSETGCSSEPTTWLTINDKPQIIRLGSSSVCIEGQSEFLPASGGTWYSTNESIAGMDDFGVATGLAEGSVRFIFTDTISGCSSDSSDVFEVLSGPEVALIGLSAICTGQTTNLSPSSGGQWVSLSPTIADINAQGVVNGLGGGTASFRFTSTLTGCSADLLNQVTIHDRPVISFDGPSDICLSGNTQLLPNSGGLWTALDPNIGNISQTGLVTGIAVGNARFRYTNSTTGCVSAQNLTVRVLNTPVISLNGPDVICEGAMTQFLPSTEGSWTSTDTTIATITNEGLVTGLGSGPVQFYFTNSAGCSSVLSQIISVNPSPQLSLVGPAEVCLGFTTQLQAQATGVWYSYDNQMATVTTSGKITAKAPGKANFYFIDSESGCSTDFTRDLINIKNCIDPDVNVTLTTVPVSGNLATNDEVPLGTVYGNTPILVSKPSGAFSSLQIQNDGTYSFVGNLPGQYRYAIQVCLPGISVNCPQFPLTIQVVDPVKMDHCLVINTDLATTYKNGIVTLPVMSNDGCISSTGCVIDRGLLQIPNPPLHGDAQFINDSIIQYIPQNGFIGSDTIIYQVCASDNVANCKWARMVVIVKDSTADQSVSASDDYFVVNKNTWLQGVNLMDNDMSPESSSLQVLTAGTDIAPVDVLNGSYYINNEAQLFFRANDNYVGPVDVVYEVCDTLGNCVKATAHILVLDNLKIKIRAYLEGGLVNNGDERGPDYRPLMKDGLRLNVFTNTPAIPSFDPYSYPTDFFDITPNFNHVGIGALPEFRNIPNPEVVFGVTGANAIVDWVFVELRNVADSTEVLATRAALIQRDGDVVDLDGVSYVDFPGLRVDSCYIVLKHRNHLDVMSQKVSTLALCDFTLPSTPTFDFGTSLQDGYDYTGLAQKSDVVLGYMSMWAGDFDGNGKLKFINPNDDQNLLFFEVLTFPSNAGFVANYNFSFGYFQGDIDMNGKVKYDNPNDDKNYLFYQILFYPLNQNFISNFNAIIEQVPPVD